MSSYILGISSYYHDSAAALISEGIIIAAAQEERFSRIKHDASFPSGAIKYVLEEASIDISEIDSIVYYEKPLLKFERIIETYHSFIPQGLKSFLTSMPIWIKDKLFLKKMIRDELKKIGDYKGQLYFSEHHLSHAASAFYPSPFEEAAILTIDGVGEWSTASISCGEGNSIRVIQEMNFPNSLGLFYSAFTDYLGFRINDGEYKMMGLAPYGDQDSEEYSFFKKVILKDLVQLHDDGSIKLNMRYLTFPYRLKMMDEKKWAKLFGLKRRKIDEDLTTSHMNLALAVQNVTEEAIIKLAKNAMEKCGTKNLVLAGGVALNSVANGKLSDCEFIENIWIQPAAGDAGGAIGAALGFYFIGQNKQRSVQQCEMRSAALGPSYSEDSISKTLESSNLNVERTANMDECIGTVANLLAQGSVVGFFQGRMEFGPRALGFRSILADPRSIEMQKKLNSSIKFREEFRPFAPALMEEYFDQYFDDKKRSPFMMFVHKINNEKRILNDHVSDWRVRLLQKRSDLPSVTHVDHTARVQAVSKENNPVFYLLLKEFNKITGCPALINTSFNLKGEPIVCSPKDAIDCFNRTNLDYLVLENFICSKPK